jgi:hypothetical protein
MFCLLQVKSEKVGRLKKIPKGHQWQTTLISCSSANSFTGSTYGTPISPSSNVIIVQYPSVELTNKNCPSGDL